MSFWDSVYTPSLHTQISQMHSMNRRCALTNFWRRCSLRPGATSAASVGGAKTARVTSEHCRRNCLNSLKQVFVGNSTRPRSFTVKSCESQTFCSLVLCCSGQAALPLGNKLLTPGRCIQFETWMSLVVQRDQIIQRLQQLKPLLGMMVACLNLTAKSWLKSGKRAHQSHEESARKSSNGSIILGLMNATSCHEMQSELCLALSLVGITVSCLAS